jgi:hypothetical protein
MRASYPNVAFQTGYGKFLLLGRATERPDRDHPGVQRFFFTMIVLVATAGIAAAEKPSIAILGLDVQARRPSPESVAMAKQLTSALRARAGAAGSPYTLADVDHALADVRVVEGCERETPKCLGNVGADLNVDMLMWGKIVPAKDGGHQVSLWLLDVPPRRIVRSLTDAVPPIAQATRAADIDRVTRRLYARIAGKGTHGTLTVKSNVADGAVFVDGELEAHLVNGLARIPLPGGRYRLRLEVDGFRAHESTATIVVDEESIVDASIETDGRCDFDDARERGDAHVKNESHGAAVVAFEEALGCKTDPGVMAKAFVASCMSKQVDKARGHYAGLPPKLQRKHRAACLRNGIDPRK